MSKERFEKIVENETRRLLEASKRSALVEKELKKLEILARVKQILATMADPPKISEEALGASIDDLLKAANSKE